MFPGGRTSLPSDSARDPGPAGQSDQQARALRPGWDQAAALQAGGSPPQLPAASRSLLERASCSRGSGTWGGCERTPCSCFSARRSRAAEVGAQGPPAVRGPRLQSPCVVPAGTVTQRNRRDSCQPCSPAEAQAHRCSPGTPGAGSLTVRLVPPAAGSLGRSGPRVSRDRGTEAIAGSVHLQSRPRKCDTSSWGD